MGEHPVHLIYISHGESLIMNGFNPNKFRLSWNPTNQPVESRIKERRVGPKHQSHKFLKGPVPLPWLMAAAQLPGKALAVGIALWFRSGLERSEKVTVPTTLLTLFGVNRHAKGRALLALERASLIAVERCHGKNPVVRLLEAPGEQ
jgi:hypothetical protein